ncbi:MAG: hypothetical protein F6K52_11855 [Moorea sp. SIO3H5]|nr:hypothetical protein [Moorena sp. SIO3H5]
MYSVSYTYQVHSNFLPRLPTPRECPFTLSFEKARGRTAPDSRLPTPDSRLPTPDSRLPNAINPRLKSLT